MKRIKKYAHSSGGKLVIRYICLTLVFGFAYYLCFLFNTTSFLFSKEINSSVDRYYILDTLDLASFRQDIRFDGPFTIEDLNIKVHAMVDSLESVNASILEMEDRAKNDKVLLDSLVQISIPIRTGAIDNFKERRVAQIQHSIDSLERTMDKKDSSTLIITGKYVELAKLKYKYAEEYANACSYVIKHYSSFIPEAIADSIRITNARIVQSDETLWKLNMDRHRISSNVIGQSIKLQDNRRQSLSFWTFWYYSICVSASYSFGDIIPNSSITRFLSCIELLICLVIIALFLESLKKA